MIFGISTAQLCEQHIWKGVPWALNLLASSDVDVDIQVVELDIYLILGRATYWYGNRGKEWPYIPVSALILQHK